MAEPAAHTSASLLGSRGGLVVVDKPPGWTSHDVVARCRKVFGLRKVGHAGTLDPDATGVLLVGLGPVTRLLRFLSGLPKIYTAEVVMGVATSTLDASGEVTGRWEMGSASLAQARAAAATLTGTIDQVPPMVSAVHVGGRRLHELARAGIEVERPARTVTVDRFEVTGPVATGTTRPVATGTTGAVANGSVGAVATDGGEDGPVFAIEVECSAGTYIRSLAADLGTLLGGGAHLRSLRRTAVGPFLIAAATPLEALSLHAVLPPIAALTGMATVEVGGPVADVVRHGKVLAPGELGVDGRGLGPWAVVDSSGELLAVYQPHGDGRVKPVVVLSQPDS